VHRTPTVANAQNLLMKKLRWVCEPQLSSDDFDCHLKLFEDDLMVEQARAIRDLMMAHVPDLDDEARDEGDVVVAS
jgi:hypothetical protein